MGDVPAQYAANADLTVRIVNEIFAAMPGRFRFTSGYRTPAQNANANGVANSYHLTAEAADFVPVDGHYPPGETERIEAIVAPFGYEVIKHNAGSGLHYHIEPGPSGKKLPAAPSPGISGSVSPVWLIMGAFLIAILISDDDY